ncbi:MAG: hypothetical protein ABIO79_17455 [Ferruginibacter sp.]
MLTKAVLILFIVLSSPAVKAASSDTLVAIFDRQNFVPGDSIEIEIYTEPYSNGQPAQTLHLWIDNVKTGQRWKYRYPFFKGRYKIALKINDSIPNGVYAFNFLLQNQFLAIHGKLINGTEQDRAINYLAQTKNKAPIIDGADLQPGGYFKIENLFYTDSVFFGFSPVQQTKQNKLHIAIETLIDSAFMPEAMLTELITVGVNEKKEDTIGQAYVFSVADKGDKQLLKEVLLKTKAISKRKKYEEEHVSGLFASDNSTTFDFYDNDELMTYTDIYAFLIGKMPGLRSELNPENAQPVLYWRNEKTAIYVDEFMNTEFSPYSISVQDIEMIKIFRPGERMGIDGQGGTVAIYTKRSSNRRGNKLSNYSFYVKGYTQRRVEWK